jgi:hypothetical protein
MRVIDIIRIHDPNNRRFYERLTEQVGFVRLSVFFRLQALLTVHLPNHIEAGPGWTYREKKPV